MPILMDLMKQIDLRDINELRAHRIEDTKIFYVKADEESCYLDILDRQLYLVSTRLKKIIEKYEPDLIFKTMPLIDLIHRRQENYYLPIFKEVEALGPSSEFNLDKSVITKLVLDQEKIKGKRIFKIKEGTATQVVIRLDVAESLLRRGFSGLCLEKVAVE